MMEIDEICRGLDSEEAELLVEALVQARSEFTRVARHAVDALRKSSNRFLVTERLHWLGSSTEGPLLEILKPGSRDSDEVKELASLVLLQLGNRTGVVYLLNAIERGASHSPIAAALLAREGIPEAKTAILNRLQNCRLENEYEIAGLIDSFEKLGGSLPEELVAHLRKVAVSSIPLRFLFPAK